MKKMICGVLLAVIGFGFALVSIIYALMNPLGIPSLFSSLIVTDTLGLLCISAIAMLCGLGICLQEAYKGSIGRKDHSEK